MYPVSSSYHSRKISIYAYMSISALGVESYFEGQNNLYLDQSQVRYMEVSAYYFPLTSGMCRNLSSVDMVVSGSCTCNMVSLSLLSPSLKISNRRTALSIISWMVAIGLAAFTIGLRDKLDASL